MAGDFCFEVDRIGHHHASKVLILPILPHPVPDHQPELAGGPKVSLPGAAIIAVDGGGPLPHGVRRSPVNQLQTTRPSSQWGGRRGSSTQSTLEGGQSSAPPPGLPARETALPGQADGVRDSSPACAGGNWRRIRTRNLCRRGGRGEKRRDYRHRRPNNRILAGLRPGGPFTVPSRRVRQSAPGLP